MNKRLVVALTVVSISATATVALAGLKAGTGINGSMHDLNAITTTVNGASVDAYKHDAFERTCVFCHTPHNARMDNTDNLTPLWNHGNNIKTFAAYAWVSPANAGKGINIDDPLIGPSRLCMACHDGSTAVDAHGSAGSVPTGNTKMTASYTDGLSTLTKRYIDNLQTTHPIGFLYDEAARVRTTAEIVPSDHGFIAADLPLGVQAQNFDTTYNKRSIAESAKKIKDTLYNGYMTCATCHDVHNTVNVKPSAGHDYNYFLYAKEEGSAICLSCHIK
jgi:hypothetical protein